MRNDPPKPKRQYSSKVDWPKDHEETLRTAWKRGTSASECAHLLNDSYPGANYTRSAVIGKVHRMGIADTAPRKASNSRPKTDRPRPTRYSPFRPPEPHARIKGRVAVTGKRHAANLAQGALMAEDIAAEEEVKAPLPEHAVTFLAREDHQCAWPVGRNDKNEVMVCGGKVLRDKRGRMYCAHHQRLS